MEEQEVLFSFSPDKEQLDYMEFLLFELNACKRILEEIIICKDPKYSYSTDNLKFFMDEFKAAEVKFNISMGNLLRIYAPEYLSNKYKYDFNFEKNIVKIYYNDQNQNGGVCACGNYKN